MAPAGSRQDLSPTEEPDLSTALLLADAARTGGRLRIVDLPPADTHTVQAVFDGLSERSRYLRFHTGLPRLPAQMLRRLSDVRPGHHVVHVAWLDTDPVGLVRWIRYPAAPDRADLAIEVVDAVHGRGVGRALGARVGQSATEAGVRTFTASVLPGNRVVRSWALALGAGVDLADRSQLQLPVASLLRGRDTPRVA